MSRTSAALRPRTPVATLAAARDGEPLRLDEARLGDRLDHELGDALATLEGDGRGAVVDQEDLDLSAIARVDQAGRVEHGDTVLEGEAGARQDQSGVPFGNGHAQA